ncbi:hypothetical protein BFW38_03380 [Terasakiispira papahanaumokuakeensis]|uniref:Uncharacterized protein n=1 Tax=Terasakiispira papahanaumokuakeensis TaxID=197479 RepID=A0A1E2V6V0_9GAMM|nr:hypothetical protein [Terasakiispira papahanaumokuakeensis]ODC02729.1 hypothetical protein BFW38_03380 [Terasakiispira papahanaumokuakeensis]
MASQHKTSLIIEGDASGGMVIKAAPALKQAQHTLNQTAQEAQAQLDQWVKHLKADAVEYSTRRLSETLNQTDRALDVLSQRLSLSGKEVDVFKRTLTQGASDAASVLKQLGKNYRQDDKQPWRQSMEAIVSRTGDQLVEREAKVLSTRLGQWGQSLDQVLSKLELPSEVKSIGQTSSQQLIAVMQQAVQQAAAGETPHMQAAIEAIGRQSLESLKTLGQQAISQQVDQSRQALSQTIQQQLGQLTLPGQTGEVLENRSNQLIKVLNQGAQDALQGRSVHLGDALNDIKDGLLGDLKSEAKSVSSQVVDATLDRVHDDISKKISELSLPGQTGEVLENRSNQLIKVLNQGAQDALQGRSVHLGDALNDIKDGLLGDLKSEAKSVSSQVVDATLDRVHDDISKKISELSLPGQTGEVLENRSNQLIKVLNQGAQDAVQGRSVHLGDQVKAIKEGLLDDLADEGRQIAGNVAGQALEHTHQWLDNQVVDLALPEETTQLLTSAVDRLAEMAHQTADDMIAGKSVDVLPMLRSWGEETLQGAKQKAVNGASQLIQDALSDNTAVLSQWLGQMGLPQASSASLERVMTQASGEISTAVQTLAQNYLAGEHTHFGRDLKSIATGSLDEVLKGQIELLTASLGDLSGVAEQLAHSLGVNPEKMQGVEHVLQQGTQALDQTLKHWSSALVSGQTIHFGDDLKGMVKTTGQQLVSEGIKMLTDSLLKKAPQVEPMTLAAKVDAGSQQNIKGLGQELKGLNAQAQASAQSTTQLTQQAGQLAQSLANVVPASKQASSAFDQFVNASTDRLGLFASDVFTQWFEEGSLGFDDLMDHVESSFKNTMTSLASELTSSTLMNVMGGGGAQTGGFDLGSLIGMISGNSSGGSSGGLNIVDMISGAEKAWDWASEALGFGGASTVATSYTNSAIGQGINSYLASGGTEVTGSILASATGSQAAAANALLINSGAPPLSLASNEVLQQYGITRAGVPITQSGAAGAGGSIASGLGTAAAGYAGQWVGGQLGQGITGKHANSNIGASVGTAAGAYFGSIIPGLGTYLGSALGGAIGSFADVAFGSGREAVVRFRQLADTPENVYKNDPNNGMVWYKEGVGPTLGYDTDPENGNLWYSSGSWDNGNLGRGRTSAFGTYGYLSKDVFEPEDLAKFLDGLKMLDDSVAQFLNESEIANIKDDLAGYYYRGDDLPDIIDDRLTIMFENVDSEFDEGLKRLALSGGKLLNDRQKEIFDSVSKEQLALLASGNADDLERDLFNPFGSGYVGLGGGGYDLDEGLFAAAFIDALQIESLGEQMGDAVAEDMFSRFSESLEKSKNTEQIDAAANAISSVANTILSLEESVKTLNFTFDDTSENAYEAAEAINKAMGGLGNLQAAQTAYYQNYFSEEERRADTFESLKTSLTDYFDAIDVAMPKSKAAFRALVESLDATTDSGSEAYVALMQIQGQAAQYYQLLAEQQAQAAQNALASFELPDDMRSYLQDLSDWATQELAQISQTYAERIRLLEQEQRIGRELRQYVEELKISELSPSGPSEKLAEASAQFAALLVKAENGDMDAAGRLRGSAQTYLENADSYYGRTGAYTHVFDEVISALDSLGIGFMQSDTTAEKLNAEMLREQQRIRDHVRSELDWAQRQFTQLTSINLLLEQLPESLSSSLAEIIAAQNTNGSSQSGGSHGGSSGGNHQPPTQPDRPALTDAGWADQQVRAIAAGMVSEPELQRVISNFQVALTDGASREAVYKNMLTALIDSANYDSEWQKVYDYYMAKGVDKVPGMINGSHRNGLASVPFDGYRAELHQAEMVLPAPLANHVRNSVGQSSVNIQPMVALLESLQSEVSRLTQLVGASADQAGRQREQQIKATQQAARHARPTPVTVG